MLTVLRSIGSGQGDVGVMGSLWIKGDDDAQWYECLLTYDSGMGLYLWTSRGPSSSAPADSINISDRVIGDSYFARDATQTWHQFSLTATDSVVPGYVWTDMDQTSTVPTVRRRRQNVRAEDGLYLIDMDGSQIHKMGITGGMWAELNQGYSIPL